MMKQYCRYCADAVLTENEDVVYCEAKKETRHKRKCITVNQCKHFKFNELDVFDIDKKYQPREPRKKVLDNQIKLEVGK